MATTIAHSWGRNPFPDSLRHFISFRAFLYRPFKSSTTQMRSRLQRGYCIGVSRRSAQATAGKGHAQGPYVAARGGFDPTALRLKVIVSTKAPPRPTLGPEVKAVQARLYPSMLIIIIIIIIIISVFQISGCNTAP